MQDMTRHRNAPCQMTVDICCYYCNVCQALYWKTVEEGHPSITVETMHMSTSQACSGFPSARESPYSRSVSFAFTWLVLNVMPHTHTHTHPFNGPLSRTTRVSRYQKGKISLDFTEARDSEWQWHQLGHMQDASVNLAQDR